jgi:hypothetical protein
MLSGNADLRSSSKDQLHRSRIGELGQNREVYDCGYHDNNNPGRCGTCKVANDNGRQQQRRYHEKEHHSRSPLDQSTRIQIHMGIDGKIVMTILGFGVSPC